MNKKKGFTPLHPESPGLQAPKKPCPLGRGVMGFTILEYALLIIILVAALLGMQIYLKRALSGKWKTAIDAIGFGRQY